ncbi:hypothetical protein [Devosia sediminis]|uniref:Uncharacterized protein n=1 Tax=Devosia sediminis TaxID=2798801 RepID=A0A934IQ92_9HYPH|nr:hypothetical protein [Devosia sediminis]MBJ3784839.1 hypothetical protein [Devosia sediminis]
MTMFITLLGGLSLVCGAMVLLYGLGAFGLVPSGMVLALTLVGLALMIVGFAGVWLSRRASS